MSDEQQNPYEQRLARRRERLERRAAAAGAEASRRHQAARSISEHIPFGQPILVGHHSEARARRDIERIDQHMSKAVAASRQAEELAAAAAAVGTGGISSDDPDALNKLQAELDTAKAAHEKMVAANKVIRGKDQATVPARLAELGFSEGAIAELLNPRFGGKPGFPSYRLSNSSANIRRIEQRLAELPRRQAAAEAFEPIAGDGWRIFVEDNRVCISFDERQPAERVAELKAHGFKWARSRSAWVRQFSGAAVHWARLIVGREDA